MNEKLRVEIARALDAVTKLRGEFDRDDEDATSCLWAAEAALSDLLGVVDERQGTAVEEIDTPEGETWEFHRMTGEAQT